MLFDQKIKYLDYMEAGVRVRGAGFLRLECWGKTCNLILQVSGLFEGAKGSFPVLLTGMGRTIQLGELSVKNGRARLELRGLDCENLGRKAEAEEVTEPGAFLETGTAPGLSASELEKVRIPLGEGRELVAVLREGRGAQDTGTVNDKEEKTKAQEAKKQETKEQETKEQEAKEQETKERETRERETREQETRGYETIEPGAKGQNTRRQEAEGQEAEGQKAGPETLMTGVRELTDAGRQASLKPGKWEQLGAIYPSITPFGDARSYLQISPGDFVILKDRSYRMVNNSFLLHGYFTYKHLILHRQDRRGEMVYYVGVPGKYYDREKEVAILFGFESFEGAAEPAREGDFGYYMMRVEL